LGRKRKDPWGSRITRRKKRGLDDVEGGQDFLDFSEGNRTGLKGSEGGNTVGQKTTRFSNKRIKGEENGGKKTPRKQYK